MNDVKSRKVVIDDSVEDFELVGDDIVKMTQRFCDELKGSDNMRYILGEIKTVD